MIIFCCMQLWERLVDQPCLLQFHVNVNAWNNKSYIIWRIEWTCQEMRLITECKKYSVIITFLTDSFSFFFILEIISKVDQKSVFVQCLNQEPPKRYIVVLFTIMDSSVACWTASDDWPCHKGKIWPKKYSKSRWRRVNRNIVAVLCKKIL